MRGRLPPSMTDDAGPHRLDDLLETAFAAGQEQEGEEAMSLTKVTLEVDGHAGFFQAVRVGLAFISENVVLGSHDDGRGETGEARGA